jgi:hypothetical protein
VHLVAAAVVVAIATFYVAVYLHVALGRMQYPFALDWVEGESLAQVARLLRGQLLYARPSYQYVAVTYPPVYYYVSAVFMRALGLGLFPLRLVSFLASLGCMLLIYLICRREGTSMVPALLAVGLFAATYQLTGTWFDIARIDMLAAFFLLLSMYLVRRHQTWLQAVSGGIMALACLTKQTNVLTLMLLSGYLLVADRKRLLAFGGAAVGSLVIASLILDRAYSGWYTFFVIKSPFGSGASVPLTVPRIIGSIPEFWIQSIFNPLPWVSLVIAVYALASIGIALHAAPGSTGGLPRLKLVGNESSKEERWQGCFYLCCAVGMLGTSWGSLIHQGGYKNDLVPAFAAMSLIFGLGIQKLAYSHNLSSWRYLLVLGASAMQLLLLYYPVGPQIPTEADEKAGRALLQEIGKQPGDVYVPFHPELALLAGKRTYASWNALYQLEGNYGGGDVEETRRVKTEFANAMARQEFSMIVLDLDLNWVWGHPERYYHLREDPVFDQPDVFWPVTGWRVRPTSIMVPLGY